MHNTSWLVINLQHTYQHLLMAELWQLSTARSKHEAALAKQQYARKKMHTLQYSDMLCKDGFAVGGITGPNNQGPSYNTSLCNILVIVQHILVCKLVRARRENTAVALEHKHGALQVRLVLTLGVAALL